MAEYDYQPTKCRKTRMVVVRKNISKMKGDLTLAGRNPSLLLHHHPEGPERGRGGPAEERGGCLRVPLYDLSNWAYMVMAALAWNLKSARNDDASRTAGIAMEFRRFIREMILLPCQVIIRARQTTLRIIGWQPATDDQRTGFVPLASTGPSS